MNLKLSILYDLVGCNSILDLVVLHSKLINTSIDTTHLQNHLSQYLESWSGCLSMRGLTYCCCNCKHVLIQNQTVLTSNININIGSQNVLSSNKLTSISFVSRQIRSVRRFSRRLHAVGFSILSKSSTNLV